MTKQTTRPNWGDIQHFDIHYWNLREIKNSLDFLEDSIENYDYKKGHFQGKPLASILRTINQKVELLQNDLEQHHKNLENRGAK